MKSILDIRDDGNDYSLSIKSSILFKKKNGKNVYKYDYLTSNYNAELIQDLPENYNYDTIKYMDNDNTTGIFKKDSESGLTISKYPGFFLCYQVNDSNHETGLPSGIPFTITSEKLCLSCKFKIDSTLVEKERQAQLQFAQGYDQSFWEQYPNYDPEIRAIHFIQWISNPINIYVNGNPDTTLWVETIDDCKYETGQTETNFSLKHNYLSIDGLTKDVYHTLLAIIDNTTHSMRIFVDGAECGALPIAKFNEYGDLVNSNNGIWALSSRSTRMGIDYDMFAKPSYGYMQYFNIIEPFSFATNPNENFTVTTSEEWI